MSIRMKMTLALLLIFGLGAAVLMGTIRTAFTRNVGLAAEQTIADAESQFGEVQKMLEADDTAALDSVLQALANQNGDEYAIVLAEGDSYELAASTTAQLDAETLTMKPNELEEGINRVELETSGDERILVAAVDVGTVAGSTAVLLIRKDIGPLMETMSGSPLVVLGVMLALFVVVAGIVALLMNQLVFKRLTRLTKTLEEALTRLAGGDLAVFDVEPTTSKDELGQFENTIFTFMRAIGDALKRLTPSGDSA